jgi:hypothetical protein
MAGTPPAERRRADIASLMGERPGICSAVFVRVTEPFAVFRDPPKLCSGSNVEGKALI